MANIYTDPAFSPLVGQQRTPSTLDDFATTVRRAGLQARQELTGFGLDQQPQQRTARLAYSPSTKQFFVGGYTFDEDDDTAAVVLSKYAGQEAPLPEGDWQDIDPASYAQYVEGIRDPGMFTLMAKNFGIGVDEMQQTAGLGLQFLGAETAGRYLADQESDLSKTQIYQRNVESIDSASGVLDWMAATVGRFGPNIVESIGTAAIGAGVGGALAGPAAPAGAPIGAVVGFFGKTAVKKALLEAAKKQLKGEALDAAEKKLLLSAAGMTSTATNALKTRYAPEVFNRLMREGFQTGAAQIGGQVARRAAQVGGAAGLSTASNIFQQTGQAYGETMADGGEGDRLSALGVGVLGGLADTVPEFLLAGRVFSEVAGDTVGAITKRRKALDLTQRIGVGAGVGAGVEGGAEAFQEALQLAVNPVVDVNSPEGQSRLLNAFAGGALLGGAFGGAGNIFAGSLADNKQETNLLLPLANNDPKYAEYKAEVKRQLGEEEYNKIFNVQRQQDIVSPLAGRPQAPDPFAGLRPFAGTEAPLTGVAPETFQVPPTPAMPTPPTSIEGAILSMGEPVPSTSGTATATLPQEAMVPTVSDMVPPQPAPPAMTMGGSFTPGQMGGVGTFEQFQAAALAQAQQAAQAAPTPSVPPVQDLRGAGIPSIAPSAPLPGGESINARLLRRGAIPQATPGAQQQGPIRQVVEQGPMRMGGQATGVQVPTVAPTRAVDTNLPSFSAARLRREAAPKGRYQSGLAFIADLSNKGQTSFTLEEIGSYIFPKEKLNALRRNQVEAVLGRMLANRLITERPVGVYNIVAEADRATQPGAGTAASGNAGEVAGDGQAGQQPTGDAGAGGKAGSRNLKRNRKPARAEEPPPAAQGAPTRSDTVQEADNAPDVVTVLSTERRTKSIPGAPVDYLVALSDGRTAIIYKDSETKDWRIDHPGARAFAPSQVGYASDILGATKKEAEQNVVEALDRMEAAVAEAKAQNDARLKRGGKPPGRPTLTVKSADLKKNVEQESPKGEGVAATPVKAAAEPKLTDRETWDETFDDKGVGYDALPDEGKAAWKKLIARRGGFTVADAEQLAANFAPRKRDKELASEVREEASKLRTLMRNGEDLPAPKSDLDDVYFAVAQVMNADDQRLPAAMDGLLSWAMDSGNTQTARDAARAYINTYVEDEDVAAAKARRKVKQEAEKKAREAEKKALKAMDEERKKGRNMLSQYNSVENAVDENGRPLKPIDKVRFKAIVDGFKRGLARAPQIYVYKNQADLQAKNPNLYQQAVAARPQGDFDTAQAAGYSFGEDKVILFSDRIATPQMLRLVLAHEAIGHYGMRALLPVKQFNALMEYVYENSPLARQIADAETDFSGMDRLEAVEEYLAKYASYLETNLLARIANALKNALNKLGISFQDDIVRYIVNHARRYTREGANFFEPDRFALSVNNVERDMLGSGRYNIPSILPWQRDLSFKINAADAMPANLGEARAALSDAGINTVQGFDNFVRKFFRLANYDSLRNHGASAYDALINAVRTNVAALRNQYNEEFADVMGLGQESRDALSYALYTGRSIAHQRMKFTPETRSVSLVKMVDGQIVADQAALDKFIKMGTVSKKELDEGTTVMVPLPTNVAGKFAETEIKIDGVRKRLGRNLTDDEYDYYLKSRRRLANIEIELLKARYDNYLATEKVSIKGVRRILSDGTLTDADMAFAKNAINHAKVLIAQNIEYDAQGLPNITTKGLDLANSFLAKVNEAVIKNEAEYTDALRNEVRGFYKNAAQADAAIEAITKFRERRRVISKELDKDVVFTLQDRLKEIVLADQMFEKAQAQARRTIAQGYIPVFREGGWQIRVEGQVAGKPVVLHPDHQNKLILTLEDDRASAERGAAELNKEFAGREVEVLVRQDDGTYKSQKVKLFARSSKTVDDVAADPSLDIDNFIHGMRMFGLATNPQALEKVIVSLTNPGSALRKALRFDDTPGYDMTSGITAMSRHIVTRASLIAKTRYQPAMRDLLDRTSDRGKLWFGDAEAVMTAREKFDAATDPREREFYRNELITNLYKYRTTNPGAKDWDGSRASFPGQPASAELGNIFYNNAIATQTWLEGSENIAESTFEGKRIPALIKAVTSVAFLGGSFAQFAQNLISPVTNVIPYLASKNGRTGFGGGFGVTAAVFEYNRAFKDVVGLKGLKPWSDPINDAKYYFDIAKEFEVARAAKDAGAEAALQAKYNLTYFEARNIGQEIREGKLIPAQANAILETSRGIFSGGRLGRAWMKFTDLYMVPFNISEQAARRATFLAAFRLEFNRLRQAGLDEEVANERARTFAMDAVDLTLGEYSNTNRPPAWREGWMSMLYMYKTYPTTAVLLFKNLSRSGKLGMLLGLMLLTGISGFPFAEDVEDIIDTLAQRFGLDIGQGPSLRKFLVEQLDEIAPGLAPYVIKGVANQFLPMDVAAKTGIGNIVPGTGFLLAGADPAHELAEVGGPLVGMTMNTVKFTYDMLRAPVSDTATFADAFRNSPVSLMRSAGDVAMYLQSGAIVDKRGYVVSPEVSAATVLTRLLGFYPAAAAKEYEFIKYSRRAADFQREVSVGFRDAWIKAMMAGDQQQAAKIAQAVLDWNEANPNAKLNNWMKNTLRAYKEARRPASERFLKSTPKAARQSFENYMNAMLE